MRWQVIFHEADGGNYTVTLNADTSQAAETAAQELLHTTTHSQLVLEGAHAAKDGWSVEYRGVLGDTALQVVQYIPGDLAVNVQVAEQLADEWLSEELVGEIVAVEVIPLQEETLL